MEILALQDGCLRLSLSSDFAAIWSFEIEDGDRWVPLFRARKPDLTTPASAAGCFPLIPFGNRVRDNRFVYEGREHLLKANTQQDPHYLHGDGWLSSWQIEAASANRAVLVLDRGLQDGSPYAYRGRQEVCLCDGQLQLELSVTNCAENALPYGLGWHPFFPLTPQTSLCASADTCWEEDAQYLPTQKGPIPQALDFNGASLLPEQWVNCGFEGWDGQAEIIWPEEGLKLEMHGSSAMKRYFVFVPDARFDPTYKRDYFCFEPMSHSANAHNLTDGGLKRLAKGETMTCKLSLKPVFIPDGTNRIL